MQKGGSPDSGIANAGRSGRQHRHGWRVSEWDMSRVPSAVDPNEWLIGAMATGPERPFLAMPGGQSLSYRQLEQRSAGFAAALAALGVGAGERVALQVDKSVEAVLVYVACLRLGAILVPLNPAYTAAEMEFFLGDAAPRVAVVGPAARASLEPVARGAGVDTVATLGTSGDGSLADLARESGGRSFPAARPQPTDGAALLYTSGTTGRSKGAMLTRGNLAANATVLAAEWQFSAADVLLHALPLFHVHGLFVAINTVLAASASLLLLPRFNADEVIRLLPRATVLMGVPTFYTRLLGHPGLTRDAVRQVRLFVSGSAPLLAETHRDFEHRTGHAILERYGLTETLINTSNPYAGPRRPGSVGRPLPGIELRLTDPDSGAALAASGTVGMIEVRGPNVFAGYRNDPGQSRAVLRADGFFITGDLGRLDGEGYLHIVGRAKDLVITGGYNVYPAEVEQAINALAGVLESAVIGVPHPDLGEGVTAVVAGVADVADVTLSPESIIAALQARLANYKVPKRVLLVAELPRNAMGKVQKGALRDTYLDLYRRTGTLKGP
jgi:malonyl-CoA/methylmalonyl-CoA synthetase